jgi:uncharacterized protein (DUF362 family)
MLNGGHILPKPCHVVSVVHRPGLRYPAVDDHHPPEPFPEIASQGPVLGGGAVYRAVRDCLSGAGLDEGRAGTPDWNPLGNWIDPGSRVFLLPNLVVDRRPTESARDFSSKCTHASVVRPVLDYAVKACGRAELVGFGNAPLQSTDYELVNAQTGMDEVARHYLDRFGVNVGPYDLRAIVAEWTRYGALRSRVEKDADQVVYIDLGRSSLLDVLDDETRGVAFRVSDYDHREIEGYHGPGRHVYAVNRRVLEADVIISVPKLKTHEKVGITCAIKGTVGSIARKECLAHHRRGGPRSGGDEYPVDSFVHDKVSRFSERITTLGTGLGPNVLRVAAKGMYRALRLGRKGIMAGAWQGNDTAWRMAVDIARILRFGRVDGTLADTPQRQHLVVIDGVVGGEAEGPVFPEANPAGLIVFATDPLWADVAATHLMQFEVDALRIVRDAAKTVDYPVTDVGDAAVRWLLNGRETAPESLGSVLSRPFRPPKGWPDLCRGDQAVV